MAGDSSRVALPSRECVEQRIQRMMEAGFHRLMSLELVGWEYGKATVKVSVTPSLLNKDRTLQGGAIAALADCALAAAAYTVVPENQHMTTIDLATTYFRPIREGVVEANAIVVRHGRRVLNGEIEIRSDEGQVMAKTISNYLILSSE